MLDLITFNAITITVTDPILKAIGGEFAENLTNVTIWSIITRLVLAFLMAGAIGIERAAKKHAAGLRTYILVCLGATMVMLANQYLTEMMGTGDAARFGAGVLSGIGFLGAGTILFTSRSQIKGLTTAAGIWAMACLGICIGCGFYTGAIAGFIAIVLTIVLLPSFENAFTKNKDIFEIHVEFDQRTDLKSFVKLVREDGFSVIEVEHNSAYSQSGLSVYTIFLKRGKKCKYKTHAEFIKEASELEYIDFIEEI